jgi:hypothetical protein
MDIFLIFADIKIEIQKKRDFKKKENAIDS